MKKFATILFCLSVNIGYSQVVHSPEIYKAFNNAIKTISTDEQKFILKGNSDFKEMGFAIFSICKIDTLNKPDLIRQSNLNPIHIFFIDTDKVTGKITQTEDTSRGEKENILPLIAKLNGNILLIKEFLPFGSGFTHEIHIGVVKTFYNAYQKNDKIFRLKINGAKTDNLNIPVKDLSFKLSSLKFEPGKTIYGEAEFLTSPFYEDSEEFKTGYIKKRIHYKYTFKIIISKSPAY